MLTPYGTNNIIAMLATGAGMFGGGLLAPKPWSHILRIAGPALCAFTLLFFRDPDRKLPAFAKERGAVLSPADGVVVEVKNVREDVYMKSDAIQISIFLSVFDVHVNRSPANGVVEHFEYRPGDYLVAFHPKSSEKNEQTHIGVKTEAGKIFYKQITGILARRLVWDIKEGDSLEIGKRFGMMKFGSRMDAMVPTDAELFVKKGDRVLGGLTPLAKLKRVFP